MASSLVQYMKEKVLAHLLYTLLLPSDTYLVTLTLIWRNHSSVLTLSYGRYLHLLHENTSELTHLLPSCTVLPSQLSLFLTLETHVRQHLQSSCTACERLVPFPV